MRKNANRDPKTGRFMHADDQRHPVDDDYFDNTPSDVDQREGDKDIMYALVLGFLIGAALATLISIIL